MARAVREESSTGLYHVLMRGNNRQWIFKDENDMEASIKFIKQEEKEKRISLLVWCVMDKLVIS